MIRIYIIISFKTQTGYICTWLMTKLALKIECFIIKCISHGKFGHCQIVLDIVIIEGESSNLILIAKEGE